VSGFRRNQQRPRSHPRTKQDGELRRKRRLQAQIARSTGLPIRRAPGCLWAKATSRVESKRVNDFANMSDEELEAYVNGDRGLEH
jgi:hypothetical protein